jgi:hypothetical protein
MNLCRKNLVNSILLFVGMLLCYNICFQQSDSSSLVELHSENSLSPNFVDFDLDINEEDQIIYGLEIFLMVEKYTQHNHFYITSKSSQPFYSVWQPPKLS